MEERLKTLALATRRSGRIDWSAGRRSSTQSLIEHFFGGLKRLGILVSVLQSRE
jgi:hypothetical protein